MVNDKYTPDRGDIVILIVANDTYFKLLEICVKSILHACDLEKISSIFIADLGLSQINKNIIKNLHKKITIIDTDKAITDSHKIHSEGWVKAVSQKTAILANLVEKNNLPVIMMDSDMIVLEDFSNCIDSEYDIQICRRTKPLIRRDGLVVNHIASFFIVNSKQGLFFINDWIGRMKERIILNLPPPHETPAMVETLAKETRCTIGYIDDKIASCENNYIKGVTKIIHAKGRTKKDDISIYRFANITHFPLKKTLYLFEKDEKLPFVASLLFKKVFNPYALKESIVSLKTVIKHILINK
jgi:hypothetical protein